MKYEIKMPKQTKIKTVLAIEEQLHIYILMPFKRRAIHSDPLELQLTV